MHNFWNDENPLGVFQGAPLCAQAYADTLTQDLGQQIHFQTRGVQLIREDDNTGRVSAVIAKRADGTYAKYEATKAVVLATGDFSKDEDMMAKYAPDIYNSLKDQLTFGEDAVDFDAGMNYSGLMPGDGHKMGLWVGAGWQKVFPNPCAVNGGVPGPSHCVIDNFWGINLNINGKRFQNENTNFAFGARSLLTQPQTTGSASGYCVRSDAGRMGDAWLLGEQRHAAEAAYSRANGGHVGCKRGEGHLLQSGHARGASRPA